LSLLLFAVKTVKVVEIAADQRVNAAIAAEILVSEAGVARLKANLGRLDDEALEAGLGDAPSQWLTSRLNVPQIAQTAVGSSAI
jgi:hypothetical protein